MKMAESNEFQQEIRDCLRAACFVRYRRWPNAPPVPSKGLRKATATSS